MQNRNQTNEKLALDVSRSAVEIADLFEQGKFPGKHIAAPLRFSKHPFFKMSAAYKAHENAHAAVKAHIELLERWREEHAIPTE